MEVGSNDRIKLFIFYFDKLMISRLISRACFPVIVRVEVPEGKTNLEEC